MGDGGSGGDPLNHGQNRDTLLGAMLRIDVDSGTPYAIPSDNPYVGGDGADEIWAIGLRNPWRFSFDRETNDLYIGDVGQNLWEEISYQAAGTPGGLNFGWRCREGSHTYNSNPPCDDPAYLATLTDPIAEYSHSEGRSVTGGFVYRGILYPALVGRYFFADYVEGKIWSLYKTTSDPDAWSTPELELDTGLSISGFGEDETGELYVIGVLPDVFQGVR
jgi:glucose/arabinose dehydrogenase